MASAKEIQKRIDKLYEEAKLQQEIFNNDKRRTTALKKSQEIMEKIFELEKELPALTKEQEKVLSNATKMQRQAGKELEKQDTVWKNLFGIQDKSAAITKSSIANISDIVEENEDLADLGNEQLALIDDVNKGILSRADLAEEISALEQDINDETKSRTPQEKEILNSSLDVLKAKQKQLGLTSKIKDQMKKVAASATKMVAGFLSAGAAIGFLKKALMAANQIAGSVGKEFGAIGMNSQQLNDSVNNTVPSMVKIGLNAADLNSSISTLTTEFGININQIDEMGGGIADMALKIADSGKAMGLNTQEATKLYGTFMQITDTTQAQAEKLLESTATLAMQSGVAPQVVMRDIANSGEFFAKHMKDGGKNVLEAAIRARQLGLNLDAVAKIGDSLMNFQSSLNAEMEAGIMIGKQINLQKARELYLSGDLVGMQDEILKQVGSEQAFNNMNIMQKQALAKAVGMNVQELQKMVSAEENMTELMGEIDEANPLKDLIGEDAMTEIDQMLARFESLAATVGVTILPVVESLVEWLNEMAAGFEDGSISGNTLRNVLIGLAATSMALSAAQIAVGLGKSAAMGGLVGFALGGIAAAVAWNYAKSMFSEAKSMKDGGFKAGGPIISRGADSVRLLPQDDFVAGTNLFGSSSTTTLSPSALKRERREERQLELAEKQAKIEEEKLKILKSTENATIGTYREIYSNA